MTTDQATAPGLFAPPPRPRRPADGSRSRRVGRQPAVNAPVARVMVDVPLPHLDRPFDYLVPEDLAAQVQPGCRVRVRFAGRLVDAYVLERRADSDHVGSLTWVERAVGEPVLTPETTALFRAVADRWAGSFVDVVRLGVPARHARAESAASAERTAPEADGPTAGDTGRAAGAPGLSRYHAGAAFLNAVAAGRPARAVWTALPGEAWAQRIAELVHTAASAGRGAVVLVPDSRDLARVEVAVANRVGRHRVVALSAELGPAERYRRWLAVRRGEVQVVVGTRAAVYAPVDRLGLLVIWDDGDDSYEEPRAPYAHARDVLALRSAHSGAALLLGSVARSAEAQLLVETGWAHEIVADRRTVRATAPRVRPVGDDTEQRRDPAAAARLPSLAWRTTRAALAAGRPVLVQVPRRGYVPALACVRDRTPARCPACSGPLAAEGAGASAACRWCGRPAADWHCPSCGGRAMRATVVGARRTAEELGRAFPDVTIRTSGGDRVLDRADPVAQLVVATPGAEPVVEGGYGAALLLDGWALLARADLRAAEEAVRRWMFAAALVAPGGTVVLGADASVPAVQAMIRWDPGGFAVRELAERAELGFTPAFRMAALTGKPAAVAELVGAAALPDDARLIGPVPVDPDPTASAPDGSALERLLIRVPRGSGLALAAALKAAAALRSARKAADPVKLVLDPARLL